MGTLYKTLLLSTSGFSVSDYIRKFTVTKCNLFFYFNTICMMTSSADANGAFQHQLMAELLNRVLAYFKEIQVHRCMTGT